MISCIVLYCTPLYNINLLTTPSLSLSPVPSLKMWRGFEPLLCGPLLVEAVAPQLSTFAFTLLDYSKVWFHSLVEEKDILCLVLWVSCAYFYKITCWESRRKFYECDVFCLFNTCNPLILQNTQICAYAFVYLYVFVYVYMSVYVSVCTHVRTINHFKYLTPSYIEHCRNLPSQCGII